MLHLIAGLLTAVVLTATPTPGLPATPPSDATTATEAREAREAKSKPDPATVVEERVTIVGSTESLRELPGSAYRVDLTDSREPTYTDIHRALQQVPGIIFQEEDGYGLRPNIGIRGTGVERSQKITLLEDGILIAPAPYTAPAAYYFPTVGRMEALEVRKGSVAIVQGPYTTGGAINLRSRSVPGQLSGSVELIVGDNDRLLGHGFVGDTRERFGWLVDLYRDESDGFKDLDGPRDDTGTEVEDILGKFRINSAPDNRRPQQFELKLGATDQLGNETYLGLTQQDFDTTPFRRYAGSALDNIEAEHEQVQGRYFLRPTASSDLVVTVYRNDFFRDWFKNESTLGVSNATILANPSTFEEELAILRGEVDSGPDAMALRHNSREYRSQGIDGIVTWTPFDSSHQLQLGLRVHEDDEDRLQNEEFFRMRDRSLERTSVGAPGSQTNRLSEAEAFSAFVEDTLRLGRFTVRAGMRYESIDYVRFDFSKSDPDRSEGPTRVRENGVDVLIPGVGVSYELDSRQRLFVGVHRGFSPPGAGRSEDTREEESVNYELGWRRQGPSWDGDVVLFVTDYDNLLGTETVAGGGTTVGELFNGGEVDVEGVELALGTRVLEGDRWRAPLRATYTYTEAEFQSSFETSFADWEPRVEIGDELPYLPEHQLRLHGGIESGSWSLFASASWSSEARAKAGQGPIPDDQLIDSRWVVDATARWQFDQRWALSLEARNLFDEVYVAARRPSGLRPGLDRTFQVGVDFSF